MSIEDLSPNMRASFDRLPRTHVVKAQVRSDRTGHYYFLESPAVSSDLIRVLRDNRDPGAANGRPLIKQSTNFWLLEEGYPKATGQ